MDFESQLPDMDDNDNLIDFQKMNFSPFNQFTTIPPNASLHQFTAAKFAQNITTADGQVVSLVSGADGNVQFLRQYDGSTTLHQTQQTNNNTSLQQAQTLILPITMPGDKPGDVQQTVQIQVLNPNQIQPSPKFQMSPMQIPIQGFQQPTVLTVAVPHDGELLSNHGLPEGVTVLAAIQPQDLQLFAAQTGQLQQQQQQHQQQQSTNNDNTQIDNRDGMDTRDLNTITIKQEPQVWTTNAVQGQATDLTEYFSRQGIINLQQFLRFNPDTIKRESQIENSPLNGVEGSDNSQEKIEVGETVETDATGKVKKKRKYKKKPPKVKAPKPGQVHIATALDGTILFCCPECQMAYPDKSNLEQHLTVHKIERRYICDLCGAGLKRKEHLERHKLGHSPERPYICSVCMKGFKRKEHLNLHFVIHSGFKNEICGECGKGFYRKDHLRKHAKSHATKRLKEEMNAQAAASSLSSTSVDANTQNSDNTTSSNDLLTPLPMQPESQTICLPGVTIHVPTSDNTTLPVQIQLPQLVTTSSPDGTTSTVVLQSPMQDPSQSQAQSIDQQIQQQIQQQLQQQLQQQQQQQPQQKPIEPMNTVSYGQSMGSTGYASTSNASQQYFNPNVINPQSALVHVPKLQPKQNSISTNPYTLPKSNSVTHRPKRLGDDLIDLDIGGESSRVSVLEAFDPLLAQNDDQGENASDCTTSYYSEYDPFDYLYSGGTQYSDPVYEAVNKIDRTPISPAPAPGWNIPTHLAAASDLPLRPPPLPPRNSQSSPTIIPPSVTDSFQKPDQSQFQSLDRRKVSTKLYENVIIRKKYDPELVAFYNMAKALRQQYKYNDSTTNLGYVTAAEFSNLCQEGTSIKLLVHPALECLTGDVGNRLSRSNSEASSLNNGKGQHVGYGAPVPFTCDINTTVEHVKLQAFYRLEGSISGSGNDYILKPIGMSEWLSPNSKLSQLECVHDSLKLEMDVQLGLCPISHAKINSIGRTSQDDIRDAELKIEDILPHEPVDTINYDNLMILLETLEDEIVKLELSASDSSPHTILSCSGVTQAVKMICALLGSLDTLSLTDVIDDLKSVCASGQTIYTYGDYSGSKLNILSETGDYAEVSLRPKTTAEQITRRCNDIRNSVQNLLETYCNAFRVDFCVNTPEYVPNLISITKVSEPVMVHLMCLHRPPPNWKHDDYMLGAQIYYGTKYIGDAVVSQCTNEISGIFPRLKFNSWLHFENLPICTLPREARLIFVLYGCTTEPAENENNSSEQVGDRKVTKIELGWSSIQFFDFERKMIQGTYLLSLWPPTSDKFLGPAPAIGTHPHGCHCPVLSIEVPHYGGQIMFPESPQSHHAANRLDFNSLDRNLQLELIDTAEEGYSSAVDKREVLWEKRYYLQSIPYALPKVLHASQVHDFASLIELHALIASWDALSPLQALELLLPRYPDMQIRYHAVRWISAMPNDQLVDYLPQLLQALKHDTYDGSPMAEFLLRRSLESPRIAHHLYWLLVHSLPGDSPQNSIDLDIDELSINQARYNRRNQMLLRALLAICGEKLSARFLAQNMMCRSLAEAALNVKQSKESLRQKTLVQGMEVVNQILSDSPTTLPLGPGLEVTGISARTCTYFNSNTLPLKINFYGPDKILLPAIFKAGDDLQQDMLTIQLVRLMDKLWLQEGLDLKMVTFNCVPTGLKKGMIEMITDAETLRKIQVEWGLTGSFKDKPIAEWLARQNPSQLEYQRAVDNFTVSCAGYSVVTYILGICDRHNDNIMLKTSGHLFHIDFGKFLGDAQMFGNFKRDRTPFVLTSDMAYVINGGDRPSTKFHHFVDLCCKAFNIVRKHGDLILHMLALMATSGITGVNAEAVNYVRNALLPGQSNPEAAASFAKMIHISLKSWFTQFNFFLHNLAQLRFSGDEGNGELLSFVPRTYTMAQDGRLKSVTVHGFQKRYDLEKYYTFILIVTRQNQPDPAYLFRSYKEFTEFHQKLCVHYPLAKLHSLPSGMYVGRSNIKTVAERRLPEIRSFLTSLFRSADEIAHSDLVYTFFHPLLRDQQEQDIHVAKVKEPKPNSSTERVCGEIKLSLQYHRGALTVMVHHARSLPTSLNGQEPNTYVKVYLKPDPTKSTKRKTKVVRKNCFPSFMETLEYRMPIEFIQSKTLQCTIWSHDSLQENEFYGGVELELATVDLRDELVSWFPLSYLSRS